MATAKTKVRIFSIWFTSFLIMIASTTSIKMGWVVDYNTIQLIIFAGFMAALINIFAMYTGFVFLIEGLLERWGFTKEAKNEDVV